MVPWSQSDKDNLFLYYYARKPLLKYSPQSINFWTVAQNDNATRHTAHSMANHFKKVICHELTDYYNRLREQCDSIDLAFGRAPIPLCDVVKDKPSPKRHPPRTETNRQEEPPTRQLTQRRESQDQLRQQMNDDKKYEANFPNGEQYYLPHLRVIAHLIQSCRVDLQTAGQALLACQGDYEETIKWCRYAAAAETCGYGQPPGLSELPESSNGELSSSSVHSLSRSPSNSPRYAESSSSSSTSSTSSTSSSSSSSSSFCS
eukprot:GHVS01037655.1.p1 GENE.GHVS01037655.1~~GHVS01037655.1.p1  ORF type:complete len:260 (+),score=46.34 GHVS01037655.1:160-939(+)